MLGSLSHHPTGAGLGAAADPADRSSPGQSLVGAVAGTAVFLAFLLFAVHLTVNLYARSAVTAQAFDAARRVASADVDHSDPTAVAAAQVRAEADARASLGRFAAHVRPFDWSGTDDDVVRLRLRADSPSFLIFTDDPLGVGAIDRTVTVRVERRR